MITLELTSSNTMLTIQKAGVIVGIDRDRKQHRVQDRTLQVSRDGTVTETEQRFSVFNDTEIKNRKSLFRRFSKQAQKLVFLNTNHPYCQAKRLVFQREQFHYLSLLLQPTMFLNEFCVHFHSTANTNIFLLLVLLYFKQ